jgi:hypothetical protein
MTLEVGVAGALDRIIQQLQRAKGHRTEFDHEATRSALVGGALGGTLAIPAGLAAKRIAKLLASHLGDGVRTVLEQRFKDLGIGDDLAGGLAQEIGTVLSHNERDLLAALSTKTDHPPLPAPGPARLGEAFGDVFVTHLARTAGAGERAALREAGQAYGQALFHALPPHNSRTTADAFAQAWDLPAPATVPAGVRSALNELPGIIRQQTAGSVQWLRSGATLLSGGALEGAGESAFDLLSNLVLIGQAGTDPFTFVGALFAGIAHPALTHSADKALHAVENLTHTTTPTARPTRDATLPTPPTPTGPITHDPAAAGTENGGSDTDTVTGNRDSTWGEDDITRAGETHTPQTLAAREGKHDGDDDRKAVWDDGRKAKAHPSTDDPVEFKTRPGVLHAHTAGKPGTGETAAHPVPPRERVQVQAYRADTTGPFQDGLNNVLDGILGSETPADLERFTRALTARGTGPQPPTPTGQTPGHGVTAADHPAPPRTTPTTSTTAGTHGETGTHGEAGTGAGTGRRTTAGQTPATRPDTAKTTPGRPPRRADRYGPARTVHAGPRYCPWPGDHPGSRAKHALGRVPGWGFWPGSAGHHGRF